MPYAGSGPQPSLPVVEERAPIGRGGFANATNDQQCRAWLWSERELFLATLLPLAMPNHLVLQRDAAFSSAPDPEVKSPRPLPRVVDKPGDDPAAGC